MLLPFSQSCSVDSVLQQAVCLRRYDLFSLFSCPIIFSRFHREYTAELDPIDLDMLTLLIHGKTFPFPEQSQKHHRCLCVCLTHRYIHNCTSVSLLEMISEFNIAREINTPMYFIMNFQCDHHNHIRENEVVEAKVRYGNLIYALHNLQSDIIEAKKCEIYRVSYDWIQELDISIFDIEPNI